MKVVYLETALKKLSKLDNSVKSRITGYINNLATLEDPRSRGKVLKGNLGEYWRYRVGDYRVICKIEDKELIILVVEIGDRKEVYKSK